MKCSKRKRLWKWVALGGGALLLIGVLLYAFSLPPKSEYEFLDGRRPAFISVIDPFPGSRSGVVAYYWVFEADFRVIEDRAQREIVDEGGGTTPTPAPSELQWLAAIGSRSIAVRRGRYESPGRHTVASGWVTVIIVEGRKPTLLERFRSWLQDRGL
ncbi:MAG: hypothetical protein IH851_06800 [Armatimonadetes bacterium]|nr:hypothetical protein [Armatimonadota bacterium]